MSHFGKVNHLFAEIESGSRQDTTTHLAAISEVFPLLSKAEKKESVDAFYKWAEENSVREPLKFGYAKYMRALDAFFHEDYELALSAAADGQKLLAEQNDADGVAICSSLSGSIYRTLGNVDLALKELWESYGQLKKSGVFLHYMLAAGYQIGSIYQEMKNYEEALPIFRDILAMAEQLQKAIWIVNASQGLGKIYLAQKNFLEAKKFLAEALQTAEQIKNDMFSANSITDLANYYSETGDYKESEKLHTKALEIREQHKNMGGAITNCIMLGELYMRESRTGEAIAALEKGLKLAEQIKVKPKIYQVHQRLAEIYQQQNDLAQSLHHYKLFHNVREEVEVEDTAKKIRNLQTVFEAEQTRKENIIIKRQKVEIEQKNIALQDTIDELTRTKVGKKAKAFTLMIAVGLFIIEELVLHFVLHLLPGDNFYLSFIVKMLIIFSLKPIDSAIEHYLLKKIIKKKKAPAMQVEMA